VQRDVLGAEYTQDLVPFCARIPGTVAAPVSLDRRGDDTLRVVARSSRGAMSAREITFWAGFTVLLCIAAVAGVLLWADPTAPGTKPTALGLKTTAAAPSAAPTPVAILRGAGERGPGDRAGSARILDGDTIDIAGQRIRQWGIDAPESQQSCQGKDRRTYECGRDAAAVLAELTRGRQVQCRARDRDRYQRIVAVCSTEAGEINASMVRRGWAVDYTQYSGGRYHTEEAAAKAEGLGLWSGRFDLPWDWRRRNTR
jgi:endonuclease YncB( thermonuclease family)